MCRANPLLTASDKTRVDVRAACDTLARWDGRADTGSRGEALWETFFHGGDRNSWWLVPFDPAHPLTTPRRINGKSPEVRRALADAVQSLQNNHTAASARRWAGITLPGCPGELGCFNVIEATDPTGAPTSPPPGQTGPRTRPKNGPPASETGSPPGPRRLGGKPSAIFGSSFIMAVELTALGPRARTILTYSQSANPASPHHRDQTILFAHNQWVTERFSEAEIDADPHLQTTTLHG
jgi:acyl-homoserine-lactone acylase